jgi:hypothetical protein
MDAKLGAVKALTGGIVHLFKQNKVSLIMCIAVQCRLQTRKEVSYEHY